MPFTPQLMHCFHVNEITSDVSVPTHKYIDTEMSKIYPFSGVIYMYLSSVLFNNMLQFLCVSTAQVQRGPSLDEGHRLFHA